MNFFRTILLVALATVLLARAAEGQVPGNYLAIGSTNIVADHAAQMTDQFWLDVYQVKTNGAVVFYAQPSDIRTFTNMTELNTWLSSRTSQCATNIFTTTNVMLDQQFIAYASAIDMSDGFYTVAHCYYPFYLIKNGNNYTLPDFSSMTMHLASDIPYRVTNINWAVMQVYNSASNSLMDVLDSLISDPSTSIVDSENQLVVLPTPYISGNYKFRLTVSSGTNYQYRVYGAQGNQIPELPNTISLPVIAKGTNSLQVTAGDVGRVLVLQGTTNLTSWVDLTGSHTNYYTGFDPGFSYLEKVISPSHFFRLKITTE